MITTLGRLVRTTPNMLTLTAALAKMKLKIKGERITASPRQRRAAGRDLGGRRPTFTDSQDENARRLIESSQPAVEVARDMGISRATLCRRLSALEARDWLKIHRL